MTTPFPLLHLPYLVLMPIMEQMEFMERIALSVLSKRARMYVKLLKMKYMMSISWFPGSPLPIDYAFSIMDVMHCKSINQFIVAEISEHDSIPIVAKLPKIDEVVVGHIWPDVTSYEAYFQKERQLLRF
ncbi:hypothetical protein GCK72_021105 [Caenorhabditis remanei]|uniref:F-box domain-containing protein n=1 Tax=Caenorhabditis remanei TaxID=31234 RepID=A0A6A5GJ51_CAERE|nr:hypothetical protein GCK72_021105 [Caenorhabditis remanei]KAF1754542.1 hypothetical protein GCK72_021105 [Caenorhabditis remanei]